MNLNKLPKDKQKHLLLVVVMTLALAALLGFGLIKHQYQKLDRFANNRKSADRKLEQMLEAVKRADRIEGELTASRAKLADAEADIGTGDLYSWVINTLRRFKANYKVEIPQLNPVGAPTEVNLLPDFPYKQASLVISGTARYHDFGRFVADLENQFPHFRVVNLSLDVNPGPGAGQEETLAFRIELLILVKPNPA